ncbi:unnamed protein product [Sympodiomycopsis kandeliae]
MATQEQGATLKTTNTRSQSIPRQKSVSPGTRLCQYQPSIGVRYGTIRYVGPVTGTKGTWLGVEWDLDNKGKHNGTHNGVTYFTCTRPGNVASFIRPPTDNTRNSIRIGGVEFGDALQDRYTHEYNTASSSGSAYSRKNLANIEIEMPNMDKVSSRVKQLARLRTVALTGPIERHNDVNQVDEQSVLEELKWIVGRCSSSIAETIPLVNYLDLSRSLINNWNTVAEITNGLNQLDSLHLHYTRIDADPINSEALYTSKGLQHLKEIGLDQTRTSWNDAMRLMHRLPSCQTIHLADNGIQSLASKSVTQFESLREINLEGNDIHDWEQLLQSLCALPSLEKLHLARNNIQSIVSSTHRLPALTHLGLSPNPIWTDTSIAYPALYTLSEQLPKLTSLNALPPDKLSTEEQKIFTMNIISRLPNLTKLNGTTITSTQRRDAELWWASHLNTQALSISTSNIEECITEMELREPRWKELRDVSREDLLTQYNTPKLESNLKSKFISITLRLFSAGDIQSLTSSEATQSIPTFQILPTWSLRIARNKTLRALNLNQNTTVGLWAILSDTVRLEMDDEYTEVQRYGLSSGDEIWVLTG